MSEAKTLKLSYSLPVLTLYQIVAIIGLLLLFQNCLALTTKGKAKEEYSIDQVDLPVGAALLIDPDLPKAWTVYQPNEKINQLFGYDNVGEANVSVLVDKKQERSLSNYLNNPFDYRRAFTDFDSRREYTLRRLPDRDSMEIYLVSYMEMEKGTENEFPLFATYVDLVTIKGGELIDSLTVGETLTNGDLGGSYRFFYIDEVYRVNIKDYGFYETDGFEVGSQQWLIKDSGHIVRYFSNDEIAQQSPENQGKFKNHLQHGYWQEQEYKNTMLLSDKPFPNFIFTAVEVVARGEYKEGERVGRWSYTDVENPKSAPMFYEIYENGRLKHFCLATKC